MATKGFALVREYEGRNDPDSDDESVTILAVFTSEAEATNHLMVLRRIVSSNMFDAWTPQRAAKMAVALKRYEKKEFNSTKNRHTAAMIYVFHPAYYLVETTIM